MPFKGLQRGVNLQLTNVDVGIGGTRSKGICRLPVDVQSGCLNGKSYSRVQSKQNQAVFIQKTELTLMKGKLLDDLTRLSLPNNCSLQRKIVCTSSSLFAIAQSSRPQGHASGARCRHYKLVKGALCNK